MAIKLGFQTLALVLLLHSTVGIYVKLQYKVPFCFFEERPDESELLIAYELDTESLGGDVSKLYSEGLLQTKVQAPDKSTNSFAIKSQSGKFKYPIDKGGRYKICFTSQLKSSKNTAQDEGILLSVKFVETFVMAEAKTDNSSLARQENIKQMLEYTEMLEKRTKMVDKFQAREIEKEGEFKNKLESANSITRWCAIIQAIVFVVLGTWQIWTLRQFFMKRGIA